MTSTPPARTFSSDFKRFFVRGLVVVLPTVLTLWIVVKAYQFVDNAIAEPINGWVRAGLVRATPTVELLNRRFEPTSAEVADAYLVRYGPPVPAPDDRSSRRDRVRKDLRAAAVRDWWAGRWYMDFIGLIVAIIAVYTAGRLLGGFFGRRLYKKLEDFITTLPVFKQVYPYVKQIVDFFFSDERPMRFNRVVLAEYPRRGIWSIGFVTGDPMRSIAARAGDVVTVFIPSSPTPFTGYTIAVPRNEIVELPLSIEEAIRFVVSGGVLVPRSEGARPAPAVLPEPGTPPAAAGAPPAGLRRGPAKTPSPAGHAADTET